MQAWQFSKVGEQLKLIEIPDPVAGKDEVVLDIKAAGLCHSDVAIIEGHGAAWLSHTPIVLGHEVAGVISAVGSGVADFCIGDRVAINPMLLVRENPAEGNAPGTGRDGGYAKKILAYPAELVRIPDGVNFEQAAPVTDAGMTSYHAVRIAGAVTQGTRVGIIGLGGLGLVASRIAVLAGADVYGVDVKRNVFSTAEELGVRECFTEVADLAKLKLDVIIDFAGIGTTTSDAINAVGANGRVVLVGLGSVESTISTFDLVLRKIQLVGSVGGTSQDMVEVYKLIDSGLLDITLTSIKFDQISDGLASLQRGEVKGRLVARFES